MMQWPGSHRSFPKGRLDLSKNQKYNSSKEKKYGRFLTPSRVIDGNVRFDCNLGLLPKPSQQQVKIGKSSAWTRPVLIFSVNRAFFVPKYQA